MLGYGAEKWRALPWWQRQAYTEGLRWEIENGGLYPQRVVAGGDGTGGGRHAEPDFVPMDWDDRVAAGIDTGIIQQ